MGFYMDFYKRHKKLVKIFVTVGVVFLLFQLVVTYFFFNMGNLPQGEFVGESISPKGTYTVMFYVTSPALSVGGTRGEVTNNKTGMKRNIYWEYNRNLDKEGQHRVIWENDEIVYINGIRLNVRRDSYDWRRHSN